jgi:multidrug efflux pump
MNDSIQKIEAVIQHDPAVDNVIAFTGGGGATNTGNIFIALKPLNVRKIGAPAIINRIRPQLTRLPVASAFMQPSQDLRIGGRSSAALYQYTIQSDTVADLATWGPRVFAEMKKLPGLQDVNSD